MKNILPRSFFVSAIVLTLLASTPLIQAEDTAPATDKPLAKSKQKYDADKDGKLSETEKSEMKEDAKEKREEKKKAELAKYDANKNGKIDPEEKEKMETDQAVEKAAKHAEMEKLKAEREAKKAEKAAAKDAQK